MSTRVPFSHSPSPSDSPSPRVAEHPAPPALLTAAAVAQLLSVSARTLWRLEASGKLPRPLRLGRSKRWRSDELAAWIAVGCPPRSGWRWEEFRPSEKQRAS